MSEVLYYVIDLRPEWTCRPCISLWRPNDCGYAYPLAWAGKYTAERINEGGSYYTEQGVRYFQRFAVACDIVEGLAEILPTKIVDCWQEGPHLLNTAKNRAALRRARYRPAGRSALAPEIKEANRGEG